MNAPYVRFMTRRDLPDVLAIEASRFVNAWTEEDFVLALRQKNCIGCVATIDERVVGFMIYELHRARLELLNLAVHLDHERQGVGRAMLAKLVAKLDPARRSRVAVMMRDDNLEAHLFLRACGFEATRVERDYYEDGDAYRFEFRVNQEVNA